MDAAEHRRGKASEGAPGSRATGATAAVSFSSEEAGTGTGPRRAAGQRCNVLIKS